MLVNFKIGCKTLKTNSIVLVGDKKHVLVERCSNVKTWWKDIEKQTGGSNCNDVKLGFLFYTDERIYDEWWQNWWWMTVS